MKPNNQLDPQSASDYDQLARKYQWFGPEILFGLCYEFVKSGDRLLDIGIGTGLCSSLFFKLGLEIFGIDNSEEMLAVCDEKNITTELKKWNVLDTPLPYPDAQFDIIISGGVFHFFEDLLPIFKEIARLIKPSGIFAFSAKITTEELPVNSYATFTENSIPIFTHSNLYIHQLLISNGFQSLKEVNFFILDDHEREMLLKIFVTKKA